MILLLKTMMMIDDIDGIDMMYYCKDCIDLGIK